MSIPVGSRKRIMRAIAERRNDLENDRPIEAYPSAVPILSLNQLAINFEVLKLPKITIPNAITAPYTSKN